MGFNRRYISKQSIIASIDGGFPLKKYFNTDLLIFQDKESNIAYHKFYKENLTDKQVKEFLTKGYIALETNL